jgi:octaprenyl-diphosphate synthase
VDDALDYDSTAEQLGKNIGDDLAEGKPTLPLIHALRHAPAEEQLMLRDAVENGGLENIDRIVETIKATGALAYTARRAQEFADQAVHALEAVPDSDVKVSLIALAQYAVARSY